MKNKMVLLSVIMTLFVSCGGSPVREEEDYSLIPAGNISVKLGIVRAFDSNLPMIDDSDFNQMLTEAERVLVLKFGGLVEFKFTDHGEISVDELFKDKTYQTSKLYAAWKSYKYDLKLGKNMPVFSDPGFKKKTADFLKMFSLASLSNYFPGVVIKDYDQAAELVMNIYHQKIEWLKSLKTAGGKPVLDPSYPPHQSFVEWYTMMETQDKYDVIIANSLIVFDLIASPYPHSVCKHAKVGGASFNSPEREVFGGSAVMINILEDYGNIPGIGTADQGSPKELKNKVVGAILLAHEIGHAFFHIPDMYDHPKSCLMNTPSGDLSNSELYSLLLEDLSPCPKCQPWVEAKQYSLIADGEKDLVKKGDLYLICADKTMALMGEEFKNAYDQKMYVASLFTKARDAYEAAGDKKKIQKCDKLYHSVFKK